MVEQLAEAWRINNRVNLFLIDKISDAGMKSMTSTRSGRSVARQFAHVHNNRIDWLEHHGPRNAAENLQKFDQKYNPGKEELKRALETSAEAIERCLLQAIENGNTLRAWKRGVFAAYGYHVAHESHHRGSILLTLKLCGHKLDQAAALPGEFAHRVRDVGVAGADGDDVRVGAVRAHRQGTAGRTDAGAGHRRAPK